MGFMHCDAVAMMLKPNADFISVRLSVISLSGFRTTFIDTPACADEVSHTP